jgi:ribosome maturation factor RimP
MPLVEFIELLEFDEVGLRARLFRSPLSCSVTEKRHVTYMGVIEKITETLSPIIDDLGYDVVRIQLSGRKTQCLQIMAEPQDGRAMNVDDCASISRAVSAVLDVEDPIPGNYTLEVSSPGLDRPLVRLADFERYAGFEAKVETNIMIDGRKRFRGRLLGTEGDTVRIVIEGDETGLAYDDISRAKLVLTDDLLAAAEEQRKQ